MRLPQIKIIDLFYRVYKSWPIFYDGIIQLFSIGQWEKWQDRAFDDLTGKKILEIGVGPGKLLLKMAKKGYSVTGLEFRKGMADEARKRIKAKGYDIDILQQSIYHLPFQNDVFHCIVLTFTMAVISNLDKAISEMKRVLMENGRIIIIAGGMPQDKNIFARILFRILEQQTSLKLERDNVLYLKQHGFEVTRTDFGPFNMVNKIVAVKK